MQVRHIKTGVIETVIGHCKVKFNGEWHEGVIYEGTDRYTGQLTTFVREKSDFENEFEIVKDV